jgi:hypothetical protein
LNFIRTADEQPFFGYFFVSVIIPHPANINNINNINRSNNITMSSSSTTKTATTGEVIKEPPTFNEIMNKAAASALRGGTAGAVAMGANVACLMWMRTTVSIDIDIQL